MPLTTKSLVGNAVHRARPLITEWPSHFPTLLDAETHVGDILASKNFSYVKSSGAAPDHIWRQVFSRTHHIIALDAYKAGAFKLDKEPSRGELWESVQDGIRLASSTIVNWPDSFEHINEARDWARDICTAVGLQYNPVDGIDPNQIAVYVHFRTARQAFDDKKFTLTKCPPPTKKRPRSSDSVGPQRLAPAVAFDPPRAPLYHRNHKASSSVPAVTAVASTPVPTGPRSSSRIPSRDPSHKSWHSVQNLPLGPQKASRVSSRAPSRTFLQQLDDDEEADETNRPREPPAHQQHLISPDLSPVDDAVYPSSDSDDKHFYGNLIDLSPDLPPAAVSEDTMSCLDPFDGH